jgi:hypothetical protein
VTDADDGGPDYTRVGGVYYRRVVVDTDGGVRVGLERVPPADVLDGVDVPESSLTWPGRVAVLTGGVTTTYPLEHGGRVVDTGDGHRLISLAGYDSAGGAGDGLLSLAGIVAGAWLVVGGYGRLPRE